MEVFLKELQKIKFENYEELWNCIMDTKVLDANGVLVDILVFENDNADEIGNAFIYTNKDLEIIMEDFENCSKLLNSQSEMTIHKEWDEIVDFIPHIRHYCTFTHSMATPWIPKYFSGFVLWCTA